jgi:hypothetical protein
VTFFEHQQMARHNTRVMIVLYAFAVAGVVLSVDVGLAVTYVSGIAESGHDAARYKSLIAMLRGVPMPVYVWGELATLAVILGATALQLGKLREGGRPLLR